MTFILGLDQGTSSSRAVLVNPGGTIFHSAQRELPQSYPHPGWVEQDPEAIWSSLADAVQSVFSETGRDPSEIACIGITNQRETTIIWERTTGRPICNAIVWQDRRTARDCQELAKRNINGHKIEDLIRSKTGLLLDAYFSATKIRWILDNVPGARDLAQEGKLAFGTVDSWLIWKLTGGSRHITDVTNASRSLLFNIHSLEWDDELLAIFDVPRSMLPEVVDSSGELATATELAPGAKITGIAGDQQAALFGQMCIRPGMAKNTYGTGCFLVMQTGVKPIPSSHRMLTTIAWRIAGETHYALEGSIFVAGAVIQWLRDGLGILNSAAEVETLAASVSDSGGVVLVPALTGLGAPHWDPHARGSIFGLTRGTTRAHIARAALEGIALQVTDVLQAMESDVRQFDPNIHVHELRVDGGASVNDLLMQMQADLLNIPIVRSQTAEATVLGACYLAGLGAGMWRNLDEVSRLWKQARTFHPGIDVEERNKKMASWQQAIQRAGAWDIAAN